MYLRAHATKQLYNWIKILRMKSTSKIIIPLVIATLLVFLFLNLNNKKTAPDLTFTTIEGKSLAMESLRGKFIVINFWATYCPGCIEEMPDLVSTYKKYHDAGLEIIAVSVADDPPNQLLAFTQKNKLPFHVVHDSEEKISQAFGNIKLTPTSIIINQDGLIIGKTIGKLDFVNLGNLLNKALTNKGSK